MTKFLAFIRRPQMDLKAHREVRNLRGLHLAASRNARRFWWLYRCRYARESVTRNRYPLLLDTTACRRCDGARAERGGGLPGHYDNYRMLPVVDLQNGRG